ncbi:MAG TPA: TetR/AcrR family transcriptional regulator [Ktedonobacterales bacterium]|jgi:AcrR family transcriptional regulator|nr:TetR/AcrR family transcriptional regulator [Ktedonobacterales bacterium]
MAADNSSETTTHPPPIQAGRVASRSEAGPLVPVTARGEATKRRILDAAEEVFGELGYYEASVSEITRRAGVAQGTFYIYYHSKREIFEELVSDLGERLRAATRVAIAGATSRHETERRGFKAFFQFVTQHRQLYHIIQEAERVAPQVADAYYQRIAHGYVHGLRAAMDAGEIPETSPEALAYALMGIGHFIALRWLIWPRESGAEPQIPDEVIDAVLAFIARGLSPSVPSAQ